MKKILLAIALAFLAATARAQTAPGPSTADVEVACPSGYSPIWAFQIYDGATGKIVQGACYNRTGSILYYDNTANYQKASAGGGITGSGTTNSIPKWTSASALGNSSATDNGANFSLTEAILLPNGAAATPSYSFTGHTGDGFWLNGDQVSVSSAGAQVALFESNHFTIVNSVGQFAVLDASNLVSGQNYKFSATGGTIAPGPASPTAGNCVKWAAGPTLADQGAACGGGATTTKYLTSNYTNATTTFSNVTGLSFSVSANTNYKVTCDLDYQTNNIAGGPKIQWTGPASPTAVTYDVSIVDAPSGTTLVDYAVATAFSTALSDADAPASTGTNYPLRTTLTLINGATAGTLQLQAASVNASATQTIIPGSCVMVQ